MAPRNHELALVASVATAGVVTSILDVTVAADAMKAVAGGLQTEVPTLRPAAVCCALALAVLTPLAVWADRLATERRHLLAIALPLLGSAVLGLGWRWTFLVNVPVGAVALLVTALALPRGPSAPLADASASEDAVELSGGQRRVLAAFIGGRLPAGRLHAELIRVRG